MRGVQLKLISGLVLFLCITATAFAQGQPSIQQRIERQAERYQAGVRTGVALDPELILVGVQAQLGPIFKSGITFRPSVEFAYGEVTSMFGFNGELLYHFKQAEERWTPYAGAGIGINLLHENFQRKAKRIDFGDFHSDTALSIVGGMQNRNGLFAELRTSIYSDPSPTLRVVIGYNF